MKKIAVEVSALPSQDQEAFPIGEPIDVQGRKGIRMDETSSAVWQQDGSLLVQVGDARTNRPVSIWLKPDQIGNLKKIL